MWQAVDSGEINPGLLTCAQRIPYEGFLRGEETNQAIRTLADQRTPIRQRRGADLHPWLQDAASSLLASFANSPLLAVTSRARAAPGIAILPDLDF